MLLNKRRSLNVRAGEVKALRGWCGFGCVWSVYMCVCWVCSVQVWVCVEYAYVGVLSV